MVWKWRDITYKAPVHKSPEIKYSLNLVHCVGGRLENSESKTVIDTDATPLFWKH